jgi:hypothetical protein
MSILDEDGVRRYRLTATQATDAALAAMFRFEQTYGAVWPTITARPSHKAIFEGLVDYEIRQQLRRRKKKTAP